jgi:hypothetical protein
MLRVCLKVIEEPLWTKAGWQSMESISYQGTYQDWIQTVKSGQMHILLR